ncbi:hypothetical protein C8J56DRAFT_1059395 [Mycena floridula]|nr:hypothetical protein C8J56DRAFT_1059395 [Mycena floridula]
MRTQPTHTLFTPLFFLISRMHVAFFTCSCSSSVQKQDIRVIATVFTWSPTSPTLSCHDPLRESAQSHRQRGQTISTIRYPLFSAQLPSRQSSAAVHVPMLLIPCGFYFVVFSSILSSDSHLVYERLGVLRDRAGTDIEEHQLDEPSAFFFLPLQVFPFQ